MIVNYRCDHEMAVRKGIRQICDKRCKCCLCAIKKDEWGKEEHVGDMPQGSANFQIRNMKRYAGRDRAEKRGRPISYRGEEL